METQTTHRIHVIVEGLVQGVGFRYFVLEQAKRFKLTGWVRNTYSGNVEVIAEGPGPALEQLLNELRRGPRSAQVTEVRQEWQDASGEFDRFEVRRSA